ncbi:MAG TPA: phosphoglycolate phosphatase [Rhizobiaceae bacterium]|nr:phosphoglycolate phosphatase [Rhizobiaceae bacterium]
MSAAPQGENRCGWPQAVLFDLDGTLIDSAPDIAAAVNELLAAHGLPAQSLDAVRAMIGNGVRKLVERAFAAAGAPLEEAALEARHEEMMAIYGRHLVNLTVMLPGATEIVTAYHRARVKTGVVTNKPEGFTRTILDHFGLSGSVDVVVGGDTGPARKPAPDMLLHALSQVGLHPGRSLMVGDSAADVGAARAAGMAVIVVRGGYTATPADELGADLVIDTLAQLPQAIERLKEPA